MIVQIREQFTDDGKTGEGWFLVFKNREVDLSHSLKMILDRLFQLQKIEKYKLEH